MIVILPRTEEAHVERVPKRPCEEPVEFSDGGHIHTHIYTWKDKGRGKELVRFIIDNFTCTKMSSISKTEETL